MRYRIASATSRTTLSGGVQEGSEISTMTDSFSRAHSTQSLERNGIVQIICSGRTALWCRSGSRSRRERDAGRLDIVHNLVLLGVAFLLLLAQRAAAFPSDNLGGVHFPHFVLRHQARRLRKVA